MITSRRTGYQTALAGMKHHQIMQTIVRFRRQGIAKPQGRIPELLQGFHPSLLKRGKLFMKTESLVTNGLTDEEREQRITGLSELLVLYYGCFAISKHPGDKRLAEICCLEMTALIKQRSPEQVAAMEKARGLS